MQFITIIDEKTTFSIAILPFNDFQINCKHNEICLRARIQLKNGRIMFRFVKSGCKVVFLSVTILL